MRFQGEDTKNPPQASGGKPVAQSGELSFDENGTPFSKRYDDIYHSVSGGPAQAVDVFLAGNALPGRWRAKNRFTVLETGFGLGLNFLATWKAWREDEAACHELSYLSIEKHPLTVEELAQAHALWPEFSALSEKLRRRWPPVPTGTLIDESEARLSLHLYFGDAVDILPILEKKAVKADVFYLDGFSPSKNPELWTPEICRHLARLAAPDATLATWTVAGSVCAALAAAGFSVEKQPGFGRKRHRLTGHYCAPLPKHPPPNTNTPSLFSQKDERNPKPNEESFTEDCP
ncbi:MAG: tRNA (5-methylaminomethyl-2-thiouridine)(34)-methyltransferase MnmD [Candidatus Accumulibacter sp.]|jgi:tRNA 5-methylaminomethyl-2-thiouridine biosynthesis bifunctional protein|nr:tRNA (5-methylaminomethyl-2-thiouridine)(34)-methyltransferase MnmD [Accumulibacter sp.]